MKIRIEHTEYKNNVEATEWSKLGGQVSAYAMLFFIGGILLGSKLTNSDAGIFIGAIVGLAIPILISVYCRKQEYYYSIKPVLEEKLGRQMTIDEVVEIVKKSKKEKRKAKRKSGIDIDDELEI